MTLQQVYRCAIDPELFAAKIEAAEKLSDDLNTGTVFVKEAVLEAQSEHLCEWNWTVAPGGQDHQAAYTRPMKAKLDEHKIAHEIAWESGPGEDTRERVEANKRWFVHDWQTLHYPASPNQATQSGEGRGGGEGGRGGGGGGGTGAGRQDAPGGGDQIHMGRGAEGAEEAENRETTGDGEGGEPEPVKAAEPEVSRRGQRRSRSQSRRRRQRGW